jgi:Sodium:sulfate symporter transmembrane region
MRTSSEIRRPLLAWLVLASCPHPAGLGAPAWHDFSLFIGVVVALFLEPLPASAVGSFGVTVGIDQVGARRLLGWHGVAHLRGIDLLHRV